MADRFPGRSIGVVVLATCVLLAGCGGGTPKTTTTTVAGASDDSRATSAASPVAVSTVGESDGDDTGSNSTATGTVDATGSAPATGTVRQGDSGAVPAGEPSRAALVTRVVDGDTIEVRYRDGETDTVRLLGVDTPEVFGDVNPDEFDGVPDSEAGREHLREWATRASAFAREELSGKEVRIVTDPRADRRDRYGRLLAYVVRSGDTGGSEASDRSENGSFNAALLRGGYARMYESSFTERERYERFEAGARKQGVGLWGFGEERKARGDRSVG